MEDDYEEPGKRKRARGHQDDTSGPQPAVAQQNPFSALAFLGMRLDTTPSPGYPPAPVSGR
jgi:hypothetical protein